MEKLGMHLESILSHCVIFCHFSLTPKWIKFTQNSAHNKSSELSADLYDRIVSRRGGPSELSSFISKGKKFVNQQDSS